MSKTIGLIGLGAMGSGMAQSLRRAGHAPFVFDVRSGVAEAFATQGGVACASPADLARQCKVVVSVVVNAAQTESVLFGDHGCASAMQPGSVFVMCSTVDPTGPSPLKRAWPLSAFCTLTHPFQAARRAPQVAR